MVGTKTWTTRDQTVIVVFCLCCFAQFVCCTAATRTHGLGRHRSMQQVNGSSAAAAGSMRDEAYEAADVGVRKRSKWTHHQLSSYGSLKEATTLKRIVADVIADRDAQIAAALFEVAKNQPHLQMMVQTMSELSQSSQRLELSINRLDDAQRRLDGRMGVISEKMSLLESRLSQSERRIEREMTQVYGKMEDFLRGVNDAEKNSDSSGTVRLVKQVQEQLAAIEELLLDNQSPGPKLRGKSRVSTKLQLLEIQKLSNTLSQTVSAAHSDVLGVLREIEVNLEHQLSMLSSDNGVFSCTLSRLLELTHNSQGSDPTANSSSTNTVQPRDGDTAKCILKCP